MQVLAPSLLSSQGLVHSLGVVACCSDYSSIHNSDCSDYLSYLSIPDLHSDSDSSICSDMHCPILPLLWLIMLIHILGFLYYHLP